MKKIQLLNLIGFLFLLAVGVFPFFSSTSTYLKEHYVKRSRGVFSAYLFQPSTLVYSSDYFFSFVQISIETNSGQSQILEWQKLVPPRFQDEYLYFIYLRHVFNLNTEDVNEKDKVLGESLNYFICRNANQLDYLKSFSIKKAILSFSKPFEAKSNLKKLEVNCE